jgi:hypothetical protein
MSMLEAPAIFAAKQLPDGRWFLRAPRGILIYRHGGAYQKR